MLSSHQSISEEVEVQDKGVGGGGYVNSLPHQQEGGGGIYKPAYTENEHRSRGRGEIKVRSGCRAEEGVNEGTAQVEKVPLVSFLEGGPSHIIFLTPLQEGLMMLSKDGSLGEGWEC